jgi:isopenicillin-N N-acyltransferase-like protein
MEENLNYLSVDTMKQFLQDHNNYPNSICKHPDPEAVLPISKMMKTLLSVINSPRERKAYITLGNPCENEYVDYQL